MNLSQYLKPIAVSVLVGTAGLAAGMSFSLGLIIILSITATLSYAWYNIDLPDPSDNKQTLDPEFVRQRTAQWSEPSDDVKARRNLRPTQGNGRSQSASQGPTLSTSGGDKPTSDDGCDSETGSLDLSELQYGWLTDTDVSFDDVGGMANVKHELQRDVVRPLTTHQKQAKRLGVSAGSVIFHGPPGTGKTHLAQAVASELDVPIAVLSGADVQSKWINESAQKVQSLFAEAEEIAADKGGAVIFIDELDTVIKSRGGRAHEEDNKVVNEFLSHLEATDDHDIVFIGATNRLDALDKAGIRPGRIDKTIRIGLPDMGTRKEIMRVQLSDRPNSLDGAHLDQLAGWTDGCTAADLTSIVNESARSCLERDGDTITWLDIRKAIAG